MDSKSNWAEHFTREDLALLCDFQSKRIDALIHEAMFFEEQIRWIIEAARRAFPLRHTDNGAGLRQLIHAIRQTKERCEARAVNAQLKRSQESMQENRKIPGRSGLMILAAHGIVLRMLLC